MPLQIIGMHEINRIFAVTDRLGLSREAIEIPLGPETPGRVCTTPSGKFQIIVDADVPIEQWVVTMEADLHKLIERE